jgi:hypothetical protein
LYIYASVTGVPLKRIWVNPNMELLPHAHFIFIFAVVGNYRSGSNGFWTKIFFYLFLPIIGIGAYPDPVLFLSIG